MFRLKILYSLCVFGKCLSIKFRNLLPILVETFLLKGGLNHMIFLFLFLLGFSTLGSNLSVKFLYPLFFSASSYSVLDELKTFSFEEFWFNLVLIEIGICFIISGGCFDSVLIYKRVPLGFFKWFVCVFI